MRTHKLESQTLAQKFHENKRRNFRGRGSFICTLMIHPIFLRKAFVNQKFVVLARGNLKEGKSF